MPGAWQRRVAGPMVNTTTVRPYSAARTAMAAAVVVLPTPPAPQQTTTRLLVSESTVAVSSRGGFFDGLGLIGPPARREFRRVRTGCPDRCRPRRSAAPGAAPGAR